MQAVATSGCDSQPSGAVDIIVLEDGGPVRFADHGAETLEGGTQLAGDAVDQHDLVNLRKARWRVSVNV